MRKKVKLFVVYFPGILVACQVAANLLYFIDRDLYNASGFYLNTFFGTNVLFALFMVSMTFLFSFCAVSRFAALAELLFAVYYLMIQQDDVYNIVYHITIGTVAILFTAIYYVNKFPFCKLSLLVSFIDSMFSTGSCEDAFRHWDDKIEGKINEKIFNERSHDY